MNETEYRKYLEEKQELWQRFVALQEAAEWMFRHRDLLDRHFVLMQNGLHFVHLFVNDLRSAHLMAERLMRELAFQFEVAKK